MIALLSPTLATYHISATIRTTIAQLPDLSFSSQWLKKVDSALAKARMSAVLGLAGKLSSWIRNKWRLSRRKSAQLDPPWPSYTAKNEHRGQASPSRFFGLAMFIIIDTRSSLDERTSPILVFAAYALITPFFFVEVFVASLIEMLFLFACFVV